MTSLSTLLCALVLPLSLASCAPPAPVAPASPDSGTIRVLSWNIWRGGEEAADTQDAVAKAEKQGRVASIIKESQADVVAMIETYGSGEVLSAALGFHFHPRGTNVSIHSRWPILKDLSVSTPFNCVGALIQKPDGKTFAFFSIWITYPQDIWTDPASRNGKTAAELIAGDLPRADLQAILKGIEAKAAELPGVPIIVAGDFNSNSHLDYTEAAKGQYGLVVEWPASKMMSDAGFQDSYRICNPVVDRMKDRTWSPRNPGQIQDRIDFIHWRGASLRATESHKIDTHPLRFPSDHAAVVSTFAWN